MIGRIALDDPSTGGTTVGTDDRTITLDVDWSGCDYKPDPVAQETAQQVTLVLKRRDAAGPGVGCEDGGTARLTAVLHHSLGTRALPIPHTGTSRQPRTG
ncbi:hypothetical protein ABZW30_40955 [Kitasatospora sp. NPDC004669]|uniref:hypothetical protein n=1 Tax=Kitasatospora sp. NPDC004669 TaxID=3154555 RepID=UPI0033B3493E